MSGQSDVEDDALDARRVLGDLEPAFAVGGELDQVAVVLEQALQEASETGIVLDDQEVHDGEPSARSALPGDRDVAGGQIRSRAVPAD